MTDTTQFIDHADGSLTVYREQDVEPILKANAEQRALEAKGSKRGDFHQVMRVPMIVIEKICNDHGLNFFDKEDAKRILQILKGNEFKYFRTTDKPI